MLRKMVCLLLVLVLTAVTSAEGQGLTREEIIARAYEEVNRDGAVPESARLLDQQCYRIVITRWPDPAAESVRGESWYVRFDAVNKTVESSYVVGLHDDGELAFLDVAPCGDWRSQLGEASFAGVMDLFQEKYGMMDSWNQAAWMAFSTELCKGRADGRNAWRFQNTVFIPVPENGLTKEEAQAAAAKAVGQPVENAAVCVCFLDGDRPVYKVSFNRGNGWEWMVELDALTGETLRITPFDHAVHKWTDCYVPQSVTEQLPPPETFLPANG